MRVSCPSCQTSYNIDSQRIPAGGAKLKCAKCQSTFPIKPEPEGAVPLPGMSGGGGGAVPLPGLGGGGGAIPLPGSGFTPAPPSASAVPLPGSQYNAAPPRTGAAVPLPGNPQPAQSQPVTKPVPLPSYGLGNEAASGLDFDSATAGAPGTHSLEDDFGFGEPSSSVPLPSADAPSGVGRPTAVPLPGAGLRSQPAGAAAVPLPGAGRLPTLPSPSASPSASPWTGPSAVPLPGAKGPSRFEEEKTQIRQVVVPAEAYRSGGAVPLPRPLTPPLDERGDAEEVDFADADLVDASAAPDPFGGADPFASQPADSEEAPPASASLDAFSMDDFPPAPAALDFDNLPPPPPSQSSAPDDAEPTDFSFSESPPPSGLDFDLPEDPPPGLAHAAPTPVDDFGLDFSEPPRPASAQAVPPAAPEPPLAFGEVDFGGDTSTDLHAFDAPPAPAADDAMSLDFGPPPEPATGAADFAEPAESAFGAFDEPAQTASPATGYQVRRRSGKIFGPFEEEVVQQMLRDGQLLGNEDVAQDGESWTPIGTVPAFAQTVQALMDSAPPPEAIAAPEATKSMDKLKKLYEGRMAQVAVLERSPEVSKAPKSGLSTALRRKAKTAAVVAGGVLILAGGASLGFTRYGAFGIKALFPAKLKPGSPEFAQLRRAREALVSGTYADYREALDLTGKLLTTREVPEVRAVWDQAVFYLQRRYGAKDVDPARRADASLEDIQLLGTKHVEVAKARAGAALRDNRPDDALPLLQDAAARADNAQDVELTLLRAEAYAAKKQGRLAKELLEKVPSGSAGSAKALHALGELHRGEGKADLAAKAFARALEANGRHVRSAVELAEVELFMRNDPVKAQAATARALHPDRRKQLGSGELSRAQALQGSTLLAQNKPKEALAVLEEAQKNDPTSAFAKAQLGRAYLALQDYAKAAPLLAEASRAEPKNLPYVEGALTALMAVGQVDEAAKRVEAANARFPGNARLAYFQGRVNDAQDKPAEAEAHYKRAISADPNLHEAQLALARLLLRFRRVADAKGPLEEAAKQFPDNPLIRAGRGELALAEDNLELAQAEFEKAAELDPNLADAYLGLAKVSIERSAPDKARVWAEKAIALNPALPEGRLQLGLALWKSGKVAEAVAELEKAKEANPKSGPVAVTIGAVKMDTGDLAGAEASLRSALVSEPSNPQALFYLAQVRSRKSEHTGAVENMREALERMPNNPEYHHQMGLIYRAARRPEDSVASWKKATELDPGHVTSWQALGEAYLLREEFAPAIAAFESGLKAAPGNGTLLALIGDAYFESQKWQQAVARYQAALRSDPKLVRVIYKVARAYSEQGRPADAMAWYKRAASAEPQNPMPFYYLGFAFKEKNQRQAAIEAFKAYLAKRPDADDKREISDEIYDLQQLK